MSHQRGSRGSWAPSQGWDIFTLRAEPGLRGLETTFIHIGLTNASGVILSSFMLSVLSLVTCKMLAVPRGRRIKQHDACQRQYLACQSK